VLSLKCSHSRAYTKNSQPIQSSSPLIVMMPPKSRSELPQGYPHGRKLGPSKRLIIQVGLQLELQPLTGTGDARLDRTQGNPR